MKGKIISALALSLALFWGFAVRAAQDRKSRATKDFMQEKLEHSQKVLEGLTLENFDLVTSRAQKLSAMSQAAAWQAFENPEYAQQSADFRKHTEALARAAGRKDIDAATLAYLRVTMSCIDCHKLVRGKLMARDQNSGFVPFIALVDSSPKK